MPPQSATRPPKCTKGREGSLWSECKAIRSRDLLRKSPLQFHSPPTPKKLPADPQHHKPTGLFKQHDHTQTHTHTPNKKSTLSPSEWWGNIANSANARATPSHTLKTPIAASAPTLKEPSLQHPRTSSRPKRWLRSPWPGRTESGGRRAVTSGETRRWTGRERRSHQPRGAGAGGGFNSLSAGVGSALSSPAKPDANAGWAWANERGWAQFSAAKSGPKVAGHRLTGSPRISLRLDASAPGSPTVEIPAQVPPKQLFKVRLTLYVGAASAEGVARSLERATHPPTWPGPRLRRPQPPGAARSKLCAALRTARGTRRRCGSGAASGCAPSRRRFGSSRERTRARRGGAAATFSRPPLAGEERCGGAPCSTPTGTSAPNTPELVCRVEVWLQEWGRSHNFKRTEERAGEAGKDPRTQCHSDQRARKRTK